MAGFLGDIGNVITSQKKELNMVSFMSISGYISMTRALRIRSVILEIIKRET